MGLKYLVASAVIGLGGVSGSVASIPTENFYDFLTTPLYASEKSGNGDFISNQKAILKEDGDPHLFDRFEDRRG